LEIQIQQFENPNTTSYSYPIPPSIIICKPIGGVIGQNHPPPPHSTGLFTKVKKLVYSKFIAYKLV